MKLALHSSVSQDQKLRHARCTDFETYNCGTKRPCRRSSKVVPLQISSLNLLIFLSTVLFGYPGRYFPQCIRRKILCIFLLSPCGIYMPIVSVPIQPPFLYDDDMKSRNLVLPPHARLFLPVLRSTFSTSSIWSKNKRICTQYVLDLTNLLL